MTISLPSPFRLEGAASAKADPRLIRTDELHLAAISEQLDRSKAALSEQLTARRAEPASSGESALDRDLEIHRISARLSALHKFGIDMCLGRIVYRGDPTPVYIGRFGLISDDGVQLVMDWRSPAAEPFFAATHARPLHVESRRRYRWARGRISDYWDEVFSAEAIQANAALDEQSAFIASLGSERSSRMKDVLSTLQADQDAIIRAPSQGALVVDGGPGTGKTVVALHRAAYLLYSDPRLGHRRGGVLVVGPHRPYLDYVSDVLPGLGEDGVQSCTLRDLVPEGASARDETDAAVARLKSSVRAVSIVEQAVRFYERPPTHELLVETPWAELVVGEAEWTEAFTAPAPGTTHNEARAEAWLALVDLLADQIDGEELPRQLLQRALSHDEDLTTSFNAAWPLLDPVAVVGDLWSFPAYLRNCAPWLSSDDVQKLQRHDARAWTTADLPLLDAARQRIGDPDAIRIQNRRDAVEAAADEQMSLVIDELIAADDSELQLMKMLRGRDAHNSLFNEAELPQRNGDTLAGPFAHIIVDEAQELTDAEWQMLLLRCPSRSVTIVGDRAQARHGFPESWAQRLERVGFKHIELASLSINYRTPMEVMAVAEPAIRAALPDANVPSSVRSTTIPVVYGRIAHMHALLDGWLSEHAEGTACVIATVEPDASEALNQARVKILSPALAKGLEFDLVVLVDPAGFGDGIEGAVDRYVSMTRATQQLIVLSDEEVSGAA